VSFLRRGTDKPSAGAGIFGGFDELFHPGGRHIVDERERQHSLRDEVGDGAPPFGVDLENGRVRLPPPKRAEPPAGEI
jgi:hypothetical protein